MLLAEARNFPVAQVWIDLTRQAQDDAGVLWALRVLPGLQGAGIGSRLIGQAEALLRERDYRISEIGVERHNEDARRLYERLGYRLHRSETQRVPYESPDGKRHMMHIDELVFRKSLRASSHGPAGAHGPATARRTERQPERRSARRNDRLVVRWTVGDVSDNGFEALRLSVWGAVKLIGLRARYVICVNSVPLDVARARTGSLPDNVEWQDVSNALWPAIRPYLGENFAEGVAWKFAPLRLDKHAHELALDNDCILWSLPRALDEWLRDASSCVIAEDVVPGFGQFADRCGDDPRNSGIRGVPADFDLGRALLDTLEERPTLLTSELDEQGLQVAAVSRHAPPRVVSTSDVSICSPFPPHLPHLGDCGAHFVGLNARSLPWELEHRPAVAYIREHWRRHRDALYERVGIEPDAA